MFVEHIEATFMSAPHSSQLLLYLKQTRNRTLSLYILTRETYNRGTHGMLCMFPFRLSFSFSISSHGLSLLVDSCSRLCLQGLLSLIATIQHLILVFLLSLCVYVVDQILLLIIWVLKIKDTSKYSESKEC